MAPGILTVINSLFLYPLRCHLFIRKNVDVVDDALSGAYQGIADVEKPLLQHHEEEKSSRLLVQHLGTQNQWMFCRKMSGFPGLKRGECGYILTGELDFKPILNHFKTIHLVGGLEHFFYCSIGWEQYSQLTKTIIFQRGRVAQPPTSELIICDINHH